MGLDAVELVMEVEDRFEIRIPDEAYCDLRTVGDLYEFVLSRLNWCPNPRAFCRVRRVLTALFAVERASVRPTTRLNDLVPAHDRSEWWTRFRAALAIELPPLGLSRTQRDAINSFGLLLGLFFVVAAGSMDVFLALPALLISFPLYILWLIAAHGLLGRLAVAIPDGLTVGDVARFVAREDPAQRTPRSRPRDAESVWNELQAIISDVLNVPVAEIRRDDRFIEDLKMG